MAEILIVDDDEHICSALRQFLEGEGHDAVVVSSAEAALATIEKSRPDVVLLDIRMPGIDGLEALARMRQIAPPLYVVMMTAYGTSQTSIDAMRQGAFDYLNKPFDLDHLKAVIEKALEAQAFHSQTTEAREDEEPEATNVALVGTSSQMQEVYKLIGLLSARDLPALLVGERGVGKHLVAKTIHVNSSRKAGPLAFLSCRSLPEESLALELLGSETVIESGSVLTSTGKLETANGGTLFIDHVDALSQSLQAKLLRYLTEGAFERMHGSEPVFTDVRILASSEKDLGDEVRRGHFNEELLDRLRVFALHLPPLRERREDIPELTAHFIRKCNEDLGLSIKNVGEKVEDLFHDYPWPGNVGELENVIWRASALARGESIHATDLGDSLQEGWFVAGDEAASALELSTRRVWRQKLGELEAGQRAAILREVVAVVEKTLVSEALSETSGNQVRAAQLLGVTRTTLRNKMARYEL